MAKSMCTKNINAEQSRYVLDEVRITEHYDHTIIVVKVIKAKRKFHISSVA